MTSSSSMNFPTASSTFLISNISSLISIRLENNNYLLWKSQFLPVLRANGLISFVDGSCPSPSEFILDSDGNVTKDMNPEFVAWHQHDQNVLCWINATLSPSVLAHVVGLKSARDVWLALERRFASLSRSHIIQLKTQLQTLKKGSQSMTDYFQKVKYIADSLAASSSPIDDDDLIIYILNGLPSEYAAFKTSIRTRSAPINIEELQVLLLCEELNIDEAQHASTEFSTTALLSAKDDGKVFNNYSNRGSNKAHSRGKGRGGRNNNRGRGNSPFQTKSNHQLSSNKPCCQICNRTGHTALDCYHRMDYSYQGRHPPSQLAAMAASVNPTADQNWFVDTGATNHITNDLNNLSLQSAYTGHDQVAVGNGQGSKVEEDSFPRTQ